MTRGENKKEQKFSLGDDRLTCQSLVALAKSSKASLSVAPQTRKKLEKFRKMVDVAVSSGETFYGINTGFGLLSDVKISSKDLAQLQVNLVRSHAVGVGPAIGGEIVRGLTVLRAHTFCLGHSAVSTELVDFLVTLFENNITPEIPAQGSVGASGDLAPLAHFALSVLGEGFVHHKQQRYESKALFSKLRIIAPKLKPKEGLSLINGTHFMTTLGAWAIDESLSILDAALHISALSLDAYKGTINAFDPRIQDIRPHSEQALVAEKFRRLFDGKSQGVDAIVESHKDCGKVQDPYSFRCIPQVFGAFFRTLKFCAQTIDTELNSVTDNPLVFSEDTILSGGNFHGQIIAQALDYLAIALCDLASMSERRIEKLINPSMSGLPAFLVQKSGLNSGFMMPQVTAAALVSENKTLSHPASIDTIPTSADKEDHVSMGAWAAVKCLKVLENTRYVLAIEALAACQGIDFHAPLKPSRTLNKIFGEIRSLSRKLEEDRSLAADIENVAQWIKKGEFPSDITFRSDL